MRHRHNVGQIAFELMNLVDRDGLPGSTDRANGGDRDLLDNPLAE